MRIVDLSKSARATPEPSARGLFDGELMDLYVAILIVVPLGAVPEIAVVLTRQCERDAGVTGLILCSRTDCASALWSQIGH